jgi:hypothetical protein
LRKIINTHEELKEYFKIPKSDRRYATNSQTQTQTQSQSLLKQCFQNSARKKPTTSHQYDDEYTSCSSSPSIIDLTQLSSQMCSTIDNNNSSSSLTIQANYTRRSRSLASSSRVRKRSGVAVSTSRFKEPVVIVSSTNRMFTQPQPRQISQISSGNNNKKAAETTTNWYEKEVIDDTIEMSNVTATISPNYSNKTNSNTSKQVTSKTIAPTSVDSFQADSQVNDIYSTQISVTATNKSPTTPEKSSSKLRFEYPKESEMIPLSRYRENWWQDLLNNKIDMKEFDNDFIW